MITFQLGSASPLVSVFYRFLLSAAILFATCKALRIPLHFPRKQHPWFIAQGICMFSVNYILTYISESMASSGLIAVTFTLLLYYNILGTRILFKTPFTKHVLWGATVGGFGIVLIFYREILAFQAGSTTLWGLIIGAVATIFASAGNLISYKHREFKVPVMASNAFGMLYGSCFTLLLAVLFQQSFETQWSFKFISSLLYLSLFGSVIAFGAYLSLVARVGAERAAYTSVLSPVIALMLSSLFEEFHWSWPVGLGIALCLLGNVITLQTAKKRATT